MMEIKNDGEENRRLGAPEEGGEATEHELWDILDDVMYILRSK